MKLRNKKTGEIKDFQEVLHEATMWHDCSPLARLNEEWEDYEEPKEYWFIGDNGVVSKFNSFLENTELEEEYKEIGNYFETKEEAEKAVEKLKAWKRLEDKGFRFKNWYWDNNGINGFINFSIKSANIEVKDIELLFGGEE